MIAFADHSDIAPWPAWAWVVIPLVLLVVAVVVALLTPTDAAVAPGFPAQEPRRATNPGCAQRGHTVIRFATGPVWICQRPGCPEAWFAPPAAAPYDQEASA